MVSFPLLRYTNTPKLIATREMGPGRAPCHYLGNCMEGCRNAAKFEAKYHLYPPALATGNLTVRANAVVVEVLDDRDSGLASGVRFVDRTTLAAEDVHAGVVVSPPRRSIPRASCSTRVRRAIRTAWPTDPVMSADISTITCSAA